ncbi:MAG: hypothetical protein WB383_01260 [Acidimicrobiales bacterium]
MEKPVPPEEHSEWSYSEWSTGEPASCLRHGEHARSSRRARRLGIGGGVAVAIAITASQVASIGGTEAATSVPVTPASLRSALQLARHMTPAHRPTQSLGSGSTTTSPSTTSTTAPTRSTTTTSVPPTTTAPTTTTTPTTIVPATTTPATTTPATTTPTTLPPATGATGPTTTAPSGTTLASIEADADWIASAQLPDGAIANYPFNGTSAVIQPYLSNYGAIGLAEATSASGDMTYANDAWSCLFWYAAHMDPTTGYVTDYDYTNGVETSTGSFDSTDSYAGTFLAAAWDTYSATGNTAKLAKLLPAIQLAVKAIESTQQSDGLTWATPTYHAKYLMDNAEVYGGLVSAENLARAANDAALVSEATADATSCFAGIQGLWNTTTNSYDWARAGADATTDTTTDWTVLYPDAFEQMWAIAWDASTSPHAATILAQFTADQPNWDQPTATAPYLTNATVAPATVGYWPFAATAFVAAGDPAADETAATSLQDDLNAAGEAWPWNTGSAGQLVLALAAAGPVAS